MDDGDIIKYWIKYKYPSPYKLYSILKRKGYDVNFDSLDSLLKSQKIYQMHRESRHRLRGHIVAYSLNDLWFMDLMDLKNYSKWNKGFKYILIAIDVFSRKVYAEPLKTKTKNEVHDALKKILDGVIDDHKDFKLKQVNSDAGLEFLNRPVKELLESLGIKHHAEVAHNNHEAFGVIDRFCRTLRAMIEKDFTSQDHVVWYDKLQDYIQAYNNTPHRGIANLTPNDVEHNPNAQRIVENLNEEKQHDMVEIRENVKFKVGDTVRRRYKRPNMKVKKIWSKRTYTVEKINYVSAVLSGGTEARLDDLQIVDATSETDVSDNLQNIDKEVRDERALKKEDLE